MCLPTKLQVFSNFWPKKMLQPFITPPPYSSDLSLPDYFLFPKLKMKLKGLHFADIAEIQEAVADELKKVQKRGIFSIFSKTVQLRKSLYIYQWSLFWIKKKVCVFLMSLWFFKKKISPKTFELHFVCLRIDAFLIVLPETVNYSYHTDMLRYVALLHFIICTTPTTHTYQKTTTKLSNLNTCIFEAIISHQQYEPLFIALL